MLSFWEKQSFLKYDFVIIGSGIVGLSTAASLKEKQPEKSVLVLERGLLPTGASTKNAGFACIGSLTELLADLTELTEKQVVALVEKRLNGLRKLRNRLGDKAIDYLELGSYELISEKEISCITKLNQVNEVLRPLLKDDAFTLCQPEKIITFGFNPTAVKAMISNNFEGQIDTGKMMYELLQYVKRLGVVVMNGAKVTHFEAEKNADTATIFVENPQSEAPIIFTAKQLAVCTNAFVNQLLDKKIVDVAAGRGQVLVTKPIENLPFQGIFHLDEGYYYFRNYGQRIIFGGGRNIDFETENTTDFAPNQQILNILKEKLKNIIIPNIPFEIEMEWSGIMGFGQDKQPILQRINPNICMGVKLGGMGVAIGSGLGEELADLLLNHPTN